MQQVDMTFVRDAANHFSTDPSATVYPPTTTSPLRPNMQMALRVGGSDTFALVRLHADEVPLGFGQTPICP